MRSIMSNYFYINVIAFNYFRPQLYIISFYKKKKKKLEKIHNEFY